MSTERKLDVTSDSYRLGELLAIIHGDGGQYQEKHGTAQAVTDACEVIYNMRRGIESRSVEIVELLNRLDRIKSEAVQARCDKKTIAFADRILKIAREES